MRQIKKASLELKRIVQFLLFASPVIYIAILYWQGADKLLHLPEGVALSLYNAPLPGVIATFLIPALTPTVYWFALYYIYKLAKQYSTGDIFSPSSIIKLKQVGLILLSADFVYMFQIAITGPLLSTLGITEHFLIIELKLGVSIIGMFILLISRIMLIASEINEQHQLTI